MVVGCPSIVTMARARDSRMHSLALPLNLQAGTAPDAQTKQFDTAAEAQLVQLLNQARSEHGLPPLTVDERLTRPPASTRS